ncbi:MAG: protein of unknown function DUF814 [Homavirus sp.]|uniref:NFACT RNA-binding domain-containing protein n=1 Tax=Homavirus sp. TaxID=2487769 RepID=A0A3G5A850_9VIRU|nr:MAG: protein of unknown function DUF814 [Homavirus sp.]
MVKEDDSYPNNKIKIGENKEENDTLVKSAKDTDIWFHLSNLPSCHVILECDKKNEATKDMIRYCAQLVKQNTKYKNFSKLKVTYTEIRNVRRTSTVGMVILKGKTNDIVI